MEIRQSALLQPLPKPFLRTQQRRQHRLLLALNKKQKL